MPLRHWGGTVKPVSAAWKCPSCGTENAGPLEAGCPSCRAGADGRVEATEPRRVTERSPFEQWAAQAYPKGLDTAGWAVASAAWDAGFAAGQQQAVPAGNALAESGGGTVRPSTAPTMGGWGLHMSTPAGYDDGPLEDRAAQTILAALAFYRDNQLAYGALPGQLSAVEVTDLITKLSPAEEPPQ